MALWVSVQAFKEQYKDIVGSTDDNFIATALQAAQDVIEGPGVGIGRVVLATADSTYYLDADGDAVDGTRLWVSDVGDLSEITSVTNGDGDSLTVNTHYTTYPKTLTQLSPSYTHFDMLPSGGKSWTFTTDAANAIVIVGKWGMWSTVATVPDAFKLSAMELAAFAMESRKAQVFDTVAIPDAGVITVPSGFPATVMARLKGWRRIA